MNSTHPEDVTDKISVARKVLAQCKIDGRISNPSLTHESLEEVVFKYTNKVVDINRLTDNITFDKLKNSKNNTPLNGIPLNPACVRAAIKEFYINKRGVPSINDITLYCHKTCKEDKRSTVTPGFKWLQLPGMKKGIIIEDPEYVAKTITYIKKMERTRQANKHIIYVDLKLFETIQDPKAKFTQCFTAVSSRYGFVCISHADDIKKNTVEKLLIDLTTKFEGPFVVVLEEEPVAAVPSPASTKSKMSDWLTKTGIPHDPEAHRGELYNLILKTNADCCLSRTENAMSDLGIKVVRRPKNVTELDYFEKIWADNDFTEKVNSPATIAKYVNSLTLQQWQKNEGTLIETEKRMYIEHLQMEEVLDSLTVSAWQGKVLENMDELTAYQDWAQVYKEVIFEV